MSATVSQHRIIRKPLLKSGDGSFSDHKWEDIHGVLGHPSTCCLPRTVRTRKALVSRQEACFWYCAWLLHFDVYSPPWDYFMHCMQWLSRTRRKSGLGWGAEGLQGKCLSLHLEKPSMGPKQVRCNSSPASVAAIPRDYFCVFNAVATSVLDSSTSWVDESTVSDKRGWRPVTIWQHSDQYWYFI